MASNKGGSFEREISKALSLMLTSFKAEDYVWRNGGSGGRATRRIKSDDNIVKKYDFGDLRPDHPDVYYFFDLFSVECKSGYAKKNKNKKTNWCILDCIDSKQDTPMFVQFWDQALNDARLSKRDPMLIFRRNNMQASIAMYFDVFRCISNGTDLEHIIYMLPQSSSIAICNFYILIETCFESFHKNFLNKYVKPIIEKRI